MGTQQNMTRIFALGQVEDKNLLSQSNNLIAIFYPAIQQHLTEYLNSNIRRKLR